MRFYTFIRRLIFGLCRLWFRLEIRGREHLPEGPFVLAPIHRSNLDFALVSSVVTRRMRFLAKDTIWKGAWGRIWDALGAIPVHRGTPDRDSLKACVAVVGAGEPLVLFPEGTRQTGPRIHECFDGAAFVQARTGVPIVPVGIGGSEAAMPKGSKFPKPRRVVVVIGPPLSAPERAASGVVRRSSVRRQTELLAAAVQAQFDEAQALAGTPNTPES
jgi:1-acyl-sn-glycerol-3-phosphate acyltransferase